MEEVTLFGREPSPFTYRVIWALKLKGIDYTYINEDFTNKSALLLKYNPVYQKVPVLVHGGKAIAESVVILEYIDETWPENPLLPKDSYERSVARFWAKYFEDKNSSIAELFVTTGENRDKAAKDCLEMLKTIEEHGGLGEKIFFGGDKIGLADLVFGFLAQWFGVIEEVVGVKIMEPQEFPRLQAWIKNFKEVPVIKENLPDHETIVPMFKWRREMLMAMTSA
ncbi:hypothetical protein IFM89_024631 [Coptis chinensis]|uniref:Glutathione S-transferase n=1 Tax=Coptis chinensis TaxID=261450 RepID=A0A835I1C9_9MAGN|nr:hypothetical protein IFM89_024631 [Coptis chinensis]